MTILQLVVIPEVKTPKSKLIIQLRNRSRRWSLQKKNTISIYVDFNRSYYLSYIDGKLCLLPYERYNGYWNHMYNKNYFHYNDHSTVTTSDVGKVSGLSDITGYYPADQDRACYSIIQPSHGYSMSFKTEDDEIKYLRVYCSKIKLDENGSIKSVTIQYQLY